MTIKRNLLASIPTAALVSTILLASGIIYASESHMKKPDHMSTTGKMEDVHHSDISAQIGEPGKMDDVTKTLEITLGDNFFSPENIVLKQGEIVRFKIKNTGEFVHEFNIGTAVMHSAHQKEMAQMMEHGVLEADKINHGQMKMNMGTGKGHAMEHSDPNSVLLEPGDTAEIIWKFSQPASLEFACNVPGHYETGMVGNFVFS